MATGTSLLSTIANFRCASGSEMTETTVTSEPVPAVVGMAKNGSTALRTLKYPSSACGLQPRALQAMIALAASIGDPPPTASTASARASFRRATPFITTAIVGSGSTSE